MQRTDYTWDVGAALPAVLEERAADVLGNPISTTYYVYGLDLISSVTGTTPAFYLYDGLGSTTGLANGAGNVTDTYQYDAFGALRSSTGSSSQPFRYTGEQQDVDVANKLYYLRARYYDPSLGRFWTEDPWPGSELAPQTANPYPYVGNNPATFVDPLGLCRTGQVAIGPVPTPPVPVTTPDPASMSASPILGEGMCIAQRFGQGGGWTLPGFVRRHVVNPVVAAITSDCAHAGLQVLIGTVQVAPIGLGLRAIARGSTLALAAGRALLFAEGVGLDLEDIFLEGPQNVLEGSQRIADSCRP